MRLRFWLTAVLAVIVGVAGVQGIAHATGTHRVIKPTPQEAVQYTPAEYFDGIYFGVGPVAELVPELHPGRRDPREDMERRALAAQVRKVIDFEDRNFLSVFAEAVQSGKPAATRKALLAGAEAIAHAYQKLGLEIPLPPDPSPYCNSFKAPVPTCGEALAATRDLAVTVAQWQHAGVAVAIPVYLWVVVYEYLWVVDGDDDDDESGLPRWTGDLGLYLDEITMIVVNALGVPQK